MKQNLDARVLWDEGSVYMMVLEVPVFTGYPLA